MQMLALGCKKGCGLKLNFELIWIVELTPYLELPNLQRNEISKKWKLLHFGKIPKKIGQNLAKQAPFGPRRRAPRPDRGAWRWLCTAWVHSRKPRKLRAGNRNEGKLTERNRSFYISKWFSLIEIELIRNVLFRKDIEVLGGWTCLHTFGDIQALLIDVVSTILWRSDKFPKSAENRGNLR